MNLEQQQLVLDKYLKVIASCKTKGQLSVAMKWKDRTISKHFGEFTIGRNTAKSYINGAINCLVKRYKYQERWGLK